MCSTLTALGAGLFSTTACADGSEKEVKECPTNLVYAADGGERDPKRFKKDRADIFRQYGYGIWGYTYKNESAALPGFLATMMIVALFAFTPTDAFGLALSSAVK